MSTPAIGATPAGVANIPTGLPDPKVSGTTVAGAPGSNSSTPTGQLSTADLHSAVNTINHMMQSLNTNVTFSVDHSTGLTVVRVVEADTGQVIRQIPSKEILNIAQALDKLQGLIIRNKA